MTTSTSLNLRAVFKTAISRSGLDAPARAVSGLSASAKAFMVAAAAAALPHGVVLFVLPGDADLDGAVADIRFFLAALEGLSESAMDRAVLPVPSHEVDPYRGMAPHVGVTSVRATALHALARGTARVDHRVGRGVAAARERAPAPPERVGEPQAGAGYRP